MKGRQGPQESQGLQDHGDQMGSFLALKEDQGRRALLGLQGSLGLADRKDGKVIMGTVNVPMISSSGVFQDHLDPGASQASMGIQEGKGSKETLASMGPLGSQGSREPLVTSDLLDPKE